MYDNLVVYVISDITYYDYFTVHYLYISSITCYNMLFYCFNAYVPRGPLIGEKTYLFIYL